MAQHQEPSTGSHHYLLKYQTTLNVLGTFKAARMFEPLLQQYKSFVPNLRISLLLTQRINYLSY
jgi:hypothetical protein